MLRTEEISIDLWLEGLSFVGENIEIARQCLVLNRNEDKAKVIRYKIMQFYFVGEFDLFPFVNTPLSVLAEVMGQIEGNGKQTALYR
jgi:hypothetical protein